MPRTPLYTFDTYAAADLRVQTGANQGDAIGAPADSVPGDIYVLGRRARSAALAICDAGPDDPPGEQVVADGSDVGAPGAIVRLLGCHTLMAPPVGAADVLILDVAAEGLRVLPLKPLVPLQPMELVASETRTAPRRFADIASVSFIAGTRLTMADGSQKPVEEVRAGDRVLTRDHGVQPVRWVGAETTRADGALAPVRIAAGTLNAARDLWLSPHHRLFIYQRADAVGVGRPEIMVKAAYLVNDTTVTREPQGFADTYRLLFDRHEIIFAEGIAVESLLVTNQTRAALPDDVAAEVPQSTAADIELARALLEGHADAAERLTAASRGRLIED